MRASRSRTSPTSLVLFGLAAWPLACSSSPAPGPQRLDTGVDAGRSDGGAFDAGQSGSGEDSPSGKEAAAGTDASVDASDADARVSAAGDADAADDSPAFTGPPPPGAGCVRSATWATGVLLSVSSVPDDDVLDAVTPDELTIVWTVGQGNARTINYADRGSTSDAFGPPQSLAAGQFVADRAALSPDGLRLVVVNADGQGFSELTRSSRAMPAGAFGAAATGSYSNLDAAGALSAGQSYGDPVLSADDTVFYYSVYGGAGQTQTIFRSARLLPGDAWSNGAPIQAPSALAAQGALRRRPTAISSDKQTLFFWDEMVGIERAGWLNDSTGAFDTFVDLGARSMAAPNQACSRLYYSGAGSSSVDLFTATSQ